MAKNNSNSPPETAPQNDSPSSRDTAALKKAGKLNETWSFWFDNPRVAPNGEWKETLLEVASFDTVAKFWSVFNNVRIPRDLAANSNYSLFRKGIEPSWEDPQNRDGGKFVLTIPKKDVNMSKRTDEWWLFTCLAVIGETMEKDRQVNGAVISIRKHQDRIALWLKSREKSVCVEIGERFKLALHLDDKIVLRYQTHSDAVAKGHSFRNDVQFQV